MKTMTIKIEDELLQKLEAVAKREDRTKSSVARLAIRSGIDRFFFDEVSKHPRAQVA